MKIIRRSKSLEAVLLLDSAQVTEAVWEKHVEELHDFLEPADWTGDPEGIQIEAGEDTILEGGPGDYVIKETFHDESVIITIVDKSEFLSQYEVA